MNFLKKLRKGKMKTEEFGVLFWFDWQAISDAGYYAYGNYVYRHILPLYAQHPFENRLYFFYDGDCLPEESEIDIPCQGMEEALCLSAIERCGIENCYVVAAFGIEGSFFEKIHNELGNSDIIGYLGKTSCSGMSLEEFDSFTGQMSLPFAFSIEGKAFIKTSFAFVDDKQLIAWGFEPVDHA